MSCTNISYSFSIVSFYLNAFLNQQDASARSVQSDEPLGAQLGLPLGSYCNILAQSSSSIAPRSSPNGPPWAYYCRDTVPTQDTTLPLLVAPLCPLRRREKCPRASAGQGGHLCTRAGGRAAQTSMQVSVTVREGGRQPHRFLPKQRIT